MSLGELLHPQQIFATSTTLGQHPYYISAKHQFHHAATIATATIATGCYEFILFLSLKPSPLFSPLLSATILLPTFLPITMATASPTASPTTMATAVAATMAAAAMAATEATAEATASLATVPPATLATVPTAMPTAMPTAVATADATTMLPPTEGSFSSRELLLASVQQHALSQGYATSITSSNQDRNIYIGCDRGGQYRDRVNAPTGAKRRKTSTRLIGCPFRLYAAKRDDKWHLKVHDSSHNHPPDPTMIAHPTARKLTPQQRQNIQYLTETGVSPRQILSVLQKEDPQTLVIRKQLYNERLRSRAKKLGDHTSLEYLQIELIKGGWKHEFL